MLRVEHIMGMPIRIDVRDPVPESAVDEAFDWFRHVDAVFSTYKDDSEISRLNRGELARDDVSDEVRWILGECERAAGRDRRLLRRARRRRRRRSIRPGS